MSLPSHLIALRDEAMQTSCESWAMRAGWKLTPGLDRSGPCPMPGCGGHDRFSIHTKKNRFNCRRCSLSGEGVIKLVMETSGVEFVEACEIITGRKADAPIDPVRAAQIAEENAEAQRRRDADSERYREKARKDGYAIWNGCAPRDQRGIVLDYLKLRGLMTSDLMAVFGQIMLRQHVLPFMVEKAAGGWRQIHSGPVMVAAAQLPDGRFGAVHQTWIDLGQAKGKVELVHPDTAKPVPAKKVRGTKKGCAIRLYTPLNPQRIIMGEGIETTLTALAYNFEPSTAYWAGVDLGNMTGRARRDDAGKQLHDLPDLTDTECFLPPDWCTELVYLAETDTPEHHTTEKIIRGLLRAQTLRRRARLEKPALPDLATAFVLPPEEGGDLNDLARVNGS